MNKRRILLVDDDIATSRLLRLGLERTGLYEVAVTNLGSQALNIALEFRPDMAVLDVCMPDMDGGEVAGMLQSHPSLKNMPIVFLTSIVSKEEEGRYTLNSGGFQFIGKPVSIEKLVRHIENILNAKQAEKAKEAVPADPSAYVVC